MLIIIKSVNFMSEEWKWSLAGGLVVLLIVPHLSLWIAGKISARVFAGAAVAVVAAIHIYFGLLEATQWDQPTGIKIHELRGIVAAASGEATVPGVGQTVATRTVPIGQNMGLYNFLFALLLVGTTWLGRLDAFRARAALLASIVVAGVIGTATIGSPKIVIVQSVPAALALLGLIRGRPGSLGEGEAVAQIVEIEKQLLLRKTKVREAEAAKAGGAKPPTFRGQHPKSVGFVVADFAVNEGIRDEFRFGVFRQAGSHPDPDAVVRFSNARVMDDRKRGGHGMSIKLSGVEGVPLMPGPEGPQVQDFLLFDNPIFFIRDAFDYLDFEAAQLWAAGDDGDVRTPLEFLKLFLAFPNLVSLKTLILSIQRKPPANPLAATYWSIVPYRLGPLAVKFRVRPLTPGAPAVGSVADDAINKALAAGLASPPAEGWRFAFEVQVQGDPDLMPIEDPTVRWDEARAPFEPLATITIKPEASLARFGPDLGLNVPAHGPSGPGEGMTFSPWHGLVEHEPLGGIGRVRRLVYQQLAALRREANGPPVG
jgi:uncharacterized membrane protein